MGDSIKKYDFKGGLKLEFEILDLPKLLSLEPKREMMIVPHRAQFHHILWIEKGQGTHYVDFKPIPIKDNTVLFISQNSVNMYDKEGTYEGKCIIFTDNFFCKNEQDHKFLHSNMLFSNLYDTAQFKTPTYPSDLSIFLNAMQTEYLRTKDNEQFFILHNMLHIFLLQAEREMHKQGFNKLKSSPSLDILLQFNEMLEKQFRKEKSVKEYAAQLNLSEKQLHKITTSLLDKTPKQHIDERVLLEAKRLLSHSTQSVKEVAYELGYDEPTNFIKYFRKHTDSTPADFRNQF